jgi:hypothetical protein
MRLRLSLLFLVAVFAATSILLASRTGSFSAEQQPTARSEDRTSLRARVKKEKAKGAQKVNFPAPLVEYADEIALDTALSQAMTVVVDVIDKHSRLIDSHNVGTFYRLRVIERLSDGACSSPDCNVKDEDFPADLPSIGNHEMYVFGVGGTVILDGVELTVKEDFDGLRPDGRYLLFVSPSPSRRFGLLQTGPSGVLKLQPNGKLETIVDRKSKLARELEKSYGNSFLKLKEETERRRHSSK